MALLCVVSVILYVVALHAPPLVQPLELVVSMAILFYASHPLGHLVVARLYGVRVDYFFLGRSRFRKLVPAARYLPVVGTKLEPRSFARLDSQRRDAVFASGVMVSCAAITAEFLAALRSDLLLQSKLAAALLLVVALATEVAFSTKVGDLRRRKAAPDLPSGAVGASKK
ncbi:MAG: hypothetical protein OK456_02130 [Thaumarchaeota archaeon]|nr:hypothetical protein [Nitrososphaerota archaeon]